MIQAREGIRKYPVIAEKLSCYVAEKQDANKAYYKNIL